MQIQERRNRQWGVVLTDHSRFAKVLRPKDVCREANKYLPVKDEEHQFYDRTWGKDGNYRYNWNMVPDNPLWPVHRRIFIAGAGGSLSNVPCGYDAYLLTLPVVEALYDKLDGPAYIVDGEHDKHIPFYFYPGLIAKGLKMWSCHKYCEKSWHIDPKTLWWVGADPPKCSGALALRVASLMGAYEIEYAGIDLKGDYSSQIQETRDEAIRCKGYGATISGGSFLL